MTLLNRSEILSARKLNHEDVLVPEWNGVVRVRCLTAAEQVTYETRLAIEKDFVNIKAAVVAATAIDESGDSLFTAADVDELGRHAAQPIERLYAAAMRLSAVPEAAIETHEKNSESNRP